MKKAFTLAEVLITLGVIGVVSVLTIPNLLSNYQEKVLETQTKKVENELSNALALLLVAEETDSLSDSSLYVETIDQSGIEDSVGKFFDKYIKSAKNCGYTDLQTSCHENLYALSSDKEKENNFPGAMSYCGNLKSGATICISPFSNRKFANIRVDVNSSKGPNVYEKDILFYAVSYNGDLISYTDPNTTRIAALKGNSSNPEAVANVLVDFFGYSYDDAYTKATATSATNLSSLEPGDCLALREVIASQGGELACLIRAKVPKTAKKTVKKVVE